MLALGNTSSQRERQLIESHLEALQEISRLRSHNRQLRAGLRDVQWVLDCMDDGRLDEAIEGLHRLEGR